MTNPYKSTKLLDNEEWFADHDRVMRVYLFLVGLFFLICGVLFGLRFAITLYKFPIELTVWYFREVLLGLNTMLLLAISMKLFGYSRAASAAALRKVRRQVWWLLAVEATLASTWIGWSLIRVLVPTLATHF